MQRRFIALLCLLSACSAAPPGGTGTGGAVAASCTASTDCAPGQLCDGGLCVAVPPPACGPRKACTGNDACTSGVCEGGCCAPACQADADCADGETCRSSVCRELGAACTRATDCTSPSTPVCDLESGACVGCVGDADCGRGEWCEGRRCQRPASQGCTSDAQCTEVAQLSRCLASERRCVACLNDAQCPRPPVGTVTCDKATYACRVVVPGCDTSADCAGNPAGPHCDSARRACVACLVDAQCPAGSHCTAARICDATPACTPTSCRPPKPRCRSDRTCVECLLSSDCPGGQRCQENHCVAEENGCWSQAQCADPTPGCDLRARACVPCRSDVDCRGRICESGTCRTCTDGIDCIAETFGSRPFCQAGRCAECIADAQCEDDGKVCVRGTCVAPPVDQPCPIDLQCGEGLVCVAAARGASYCRARCDPYAPGNPCGADRRCTFATVRSGLPIGACMPALVGSPQEGAACDDAAPCDTGLACVPEGPGTSRCRRLCDPNRSTAACAAGTECQPYFVVDAYGVPRPVGACFPPSSLLEPCTTDASCGPGMACAPSPDPQNPTRFDNFCRWAGGGAIAGQPCNTNAECRSGTCLQGLPKGLGASGFCLGACSSDAQCPARPDGVAGACGSYPVPWVDGAGASTTINVKTCAVQCKEDLECPFGFACEAVPNATGTAWVTRCRPVPPGASRKGGAPCTANADCRTGKCITFGPRPQGYCQGVCGGPGGAANCEVGSECPPDGVMLTVGARADQRAPARVCWGRRCTRDLDCDANPDPALRGRTCGADVDPQNPADIVLSCRPVQGAKVGGASCAQDAECQTNYCVRWPSGGRCFGACQQAGDCAQGSRCATGVWTNTTPNKPLGYCRPP
jgi:hypothetical protein